MNSTRQEVMSIAKKNDSVNKQIDTNYKQLHSKECDLIHQLVALIFCHIRRSIQWSDWLL